MSFYLRVTVAEESEVMVRQFYTEFQESVNVSKFQFLAEIGVFD